MAVSGVGGGTGSVMGPGVLRAHAGVGRTVWLSMRGGPCGICVVTGQSPREDGNDGWMTGCRAKTSPRLPSSSTRTNSASLLSRWPTFSARTGNRCQQTCVPTCSPSWIACSSAIASHEASRAVLSDEQRARRAAEADVVLSALRGYLCRPGGPGEVTGRASLACPGCHRRSAPPAVWRCHGVKTGRFRRVRRCLRAATIASR
jgi:hypothetical protein